MLSAVNSSTEQDIVKYKKVARRIHTLWCQSLGQYKIMTVSLHLLLAHGHLFLDYAQNVLKCANGRLSESSIESANKTNRLFRFMFSRKNGLKNERYDIMLRHLWQSDPVVIAFYSMQTWAEGRIGTGKKPVFPDKLVWLSVVQYREIYLLQYSSQRIFSRLGCSTNTSVIN